MNSNRQIRTDLAVEARQLWQENAEETTTLPGVRASEQTRGSFSVVTVEVLDRRGEEALGKPAGKYITVELDGLVRREENAFADAAGLLAEVLRDLLTLLQFFVSAQKNSPLSGVRLPNHVGSDRISHFDRFRE